MVVINQLLQLFNRFYMTLVASMFLIYHLSFLFRYRELSTVQMRLSLFFQHYLVANVANQLLYYQPAMLLLSYCQMFELKYYYIFCPISNK